MTWSITYYLFLVIAIVSKIGRMLYLNLDLLNSANTFYKRSHSTIANTKPKDLRWSLRWLSIEK